MMTAITIILSFLAGGLAVALLWRVYAAFEKRLTILEIKKAEEEKRAIPTKDHYRYNEIAAMQDIAANTSALECEMVEIQGRLNTIRMIANSIAKQPKLYDPDKSSRNQL